MSEQLTLIGPCCHHDGCTEPVVGTSIRSLDGEEKVCRRHNEIEWGWSLRSYWPEMSARLLSGAP